MMSGPIPPSEPSRTIPSASIQKWTGSATAPQASDTLPVAVETEREGRGEPLRERRDKTLLFLDVDRQDDETRIRISRRKPVHQREFVLARRTPGGHEVHPDRLAAQGREIDRPASDLRDDERRGNLTDVEQADPSVDAGDALAAADAGPGDDESPGSAESLGADAGGATVGVGMSGSGMNATMPASRTAAVATPTSRPATIDDRGPKRDTRARVPVPASEGGPCDPLLPCRSDGRPGEPDPHSPLAGAPDGARCRRSRGRSAVADQHRSSRNRCRARRRPSSRSVEPTATPLITFPPTAHRSPRSRAARRRPPIGSPRGSALPHSTSISPSSSSPGRRMPIRGATSRCTSRSSASRVRAARSTSTPMRGPGCSSRSSMHPRCRTGDRCSGWSSRSGRATISASCTRSPRSGGTSSTSTMRSTRTVRSCGSRRRKGRGGRPARPR